MRLIRSALLAVFLVGSAGCASGGGAAHTTLAPRRAFVEVDNNSSAEVVVRFDSRAEWQNGGFLGVVLPNTRATFEVPSTDGRVLLQRRNGTHLNGRLVRDIHVRRFTRPATSDT